MQIKCGRIIAGCLTALAVTALPVMAAEYTFTNSVGSQSYNTGGNWNPAGPPTAADNAVFTQSASYTVTWSAGITNTSAFFDAPGTVTNTLQPGANTWGLTDTLHIGPSATAATTVKLDGGTYAFKSIMLTNVTASGAGKSFLQMKKGTLTTTGDSEIHMATNGPGMAYFMIGDQGVNGDLFTWNITGGTTKIFTPGPSGENQSSLYVGRFNYYGQGILNVSGPSTVVTNLTTVYVGDATYANPANSVRISNGAKFYDSGVYWMGRSCQNNQTVVEGTNSLLQAGYVQVGKNGAYTTFTVTNGARVVAGGFAIEEGGHHGQIIVTGPGSSFYSTGVGNNGMGASGNTRSNSILVANGASFYNGGSMQFGKSANGFSPNQEIHVTGAGTTFTNMGSISMEGSNGYFRVSAGAQAYLNWNGAPGSSNGRIEVTGANSVLSATPGSLGSSTALTVSDGGAYVVRSAVVYLGAYGGPSASILVTGAGSSWTGIGSPFRVGMLGSADISVANGGRFIFTDDSGGWGVSIGYVAGQTGTVVVAGVNSVFDFTSASYGSIKVGESGVGRLTVTNQATFGLYSRNGLVVGAVASAAGSTVLVGDGGLMDWRRGDLQDPGGISVGAFAGNSVSNIGGIFQFATATPAMSPGAFGNIVVNGGTMGFRSIANADVKGNWTGTLTNILFLGNNTFRLNAATNINNANQAYTFATGLGATNYVNLDLLNGSMYRGGNVIIGSGGTLTVTGGVSVIASNLTLQSGGTYKVALEAGGFSRAAVEGTVTLGGTLAIELKAAPQKDVAYRLIDNTGANPVSGHFETGSQTLSYGGTNYLLSVRVNRGDGNDVVAGWFTKGTLLRLF